MSAIHWTSLHHHPHTLRLHTCRCNNSSQIDSMAAWPRCGVSQHAAQQLNHVPAHHFALGPSRQGYMLGGSYLDCVAGCALCRPACDLERADHTNSIGRHGSDGAHPLCPRCVIETFLTELEHLEIRGARCTSRKLR
jgi:hypothetical protein